jgi:hypothetical protein
MTDNQPTPVRLDHDYEGGTTIEPTDATWGVMAHATPEEIAEWQKAIDDYGRVQAVMYRRWKEALDAELAARPPEPPREPGPGEVVSAITFADLCRKDDEWAREVAEKLSRAAILAGFKKIDAAWGTTKEEPQP